MNHRLPVRTPWTSRTRTDTGRILGTGGSAVPSKLLLTNATDEQLGNQHGFVVEQRGSRCQMVLVSPTLEFESVGICADQ